MPGVQEGAKAGTYRTVLDAGLPVLAAGALLGALLRMFDPSAALSERLNETTLLYLGAAGALLLLRHVKSLTIGGSTVEFEQKIRQLEAAASQATTRAALVEDQLALGTRPVPKSAAGELASQDPHKGAFGGRDRANHRRLKARVEPLGGDGEWFAVELVVEPTSPEHPLTDGVQFFLHPTFRESKPVVPVGQDGKASLVLKAWGAFTVGAVADGGATRLELDLVHAEGAAEPFVSR